VSETSRSGIEAGPDRAFPPRLLGIFAAWRLQAYGYTLAVAYALFFVFAYRWGMWVVDKTGMPVLNDFTAFWIGGRQALHGETASLYDSAQFAKIQAAAVHIASFNDFYPNFPYPPIFLLMMAPFAVLPRAAAFLIFEFVTLLGYVAIVFLIARRPAAIAVALASPFTFWNFGFGQTGFLRASLSGAALLALERRPVLSGVLIGFLTYKPQLGILFPVALAAARQWRAFTAAAITAAVLAGISIAAFGVGPWEALPRELLAQTGGYLLRDNPVLSRWAVFQTVYGLIRALHGNAALAWLAQACAAAGVATIVWLVWRSPARFPLKAAMLSSATLLATPYGWAYDMTEIAIPLAFLASDQMRCGLLRGEQTIILALFAACASIVVRGGSPPLGPVVMITLAGLILRRVYRDGGEPEPAAAA
jgi:arabinofuranan 3-O-arabinosyltransferase